MNYFIKNTTYRRVNAMAVTTIHAHVNRAKEFSLRNDVYFAIGKSSPWTDDNLPPDEDFQAIALQEIIGYKKVETTYLVRPAKEGEEIDIAYREEGWVIVPYDQALIEGARWIYIKTNLLYNELPLGYYRQVGVYSGVTKKGTIPAGQDNLLPDEVQDAGILEVLDNRQPSNRQLDQRETLSLILEF